MRTLRPWSFVIALGLVSLAADVVYEGERSVIGPYLGLLGASAFLIGFASGAAEFLGYALRVVFGLRVARTQHYWRWTIAGYVLTVAAVPLLGFVKSVPAALVLYGAERLGKAVRSPAKDTLLSHATAHTGRGKGFGVHQAMDSVGALTGPLLVAATLALTDTDYRWAFGVLAVPGVLVVVLLFWLRSRVPDPREYETVPDPAASADDPPSQAQPVATGAAQLRLPSRFWAYSGVVGLVSCGIAAFPLITFHAAAQGLVHTDALPLLYAVAMLVDAAAGLVLGRTYDRRGPRVLLLVPVAAALASVTFTSSTALLWLGAAVWGLVNGVLDSTAKAVVTELVAPERRAPAFGWFALARGTGLFVAGVGLGAAYTHGTTTAIVAIVAVNVLALVGLWLVLRRIGALD